MSKRGNNQGSISQEKGRWAARVTTPYGRKRLGTYATKREAQAAIRAALTQLDQGTYLDPTKGTVTVLEWCTRYINDARGIRSPKTTDTYRGLLHNHIAPQIGATPINKLTTATVRAWYLERCTATKSQADKAYRLLRAALNQAVEDQLIAGNPCRVKGAGIEQALERPTVTRAELFQLAEGLPDHLHAVPFTACLAMLRLGELGGLRRQDVDLEAGTLTVARQLQLVAGGYVFRAPKTRSARLVPIPGLLVDVLAGHMERFTARGVDALVFTGQEGGPLGQRVWHKYWKRAREQAGLAHIHLHDLRHTGATWATQAGAPLRDVMALLGHSTVDAALRYQHACMKNRRAVMDQVGASLGEHTPSKQLLRVVSW